MAIKTTTSTEPANIALSALRLTSHRNLSKISVTESIRQASDNDRSAPLSVGSSISQPEPVSPPLDDKKIRQRGHIQFAALCFCLFLAGWNDGKFFEFRHIIL